MKHRKLPLAAWRTLILFVCPALLMAACGGGSSGNSLVSIAITPATSSLASGLTQQFTASGHYSNNTTQNLAKGVTWASSAPAIATVNSTSGFFKAVAPGSTTITATSGSVSGTLSLTVTSPVVQSISVTPSPASSGVGISLQLIAIGSYSDGTTKNVSTNADWTSAVTSIATVGQATGIITGVALGSTTITAAIGSVTASVPLSITANSWFPTGNLATARAYHTATLLPSGKVLVAGGLEFSGSFAPSEVTASAELYDPVSGTWSTTGSLATARLGHTATLLPNGTVLVVGGNATAVDGTPLASAEIYDPVTGTWSPTGSLATARSVHSTVLLTTGNVLVMGGGLASSELYNPAIATWSATGSMLLPTYGGTATLLGNGKVLVDGGTNPGDPSPPDQLYDPVAGTWSATGVNVIGNLVGQTATVLPDGMVLVTGGNSGGASPGSSVACGLYDPTTGTWSVTGSLATLRAHHTATLLPNGTVLVAGGVENEYGWVATTAEIYSPTTGTWSPAGTLATPVVYQTMTLLMNGAVLVSGGEAGLPSGAQYIISASTAASQLY